MDSDDDSFKETSWASESLIVANLEGTLRKCNPSTDLTICETPTDQLGQAMYTVFDPLVCGDCHQEFNQSRDFVDHLFGCGDRRYHKRALPVYKAIGLVPKEAQDALERAQKARRVVVATPFMDRPEISFQVSLRSQLAPFILRGVAVTCQIPAARKSCSLGIMNQTTIVRYPDIPVVYFVPGEVLNPSCRKAIQRNARRNRRRREHRREQKQRMRAGGAQTRDEKPMPEKALPKEVKPMSPKDEKPTPLVPVRKPTLEPVEESETEQMDMEDIINAQVMIAQLEEDGWKEIEVLVPDVLLSRDTEVQSILVKCGYGKMAAEARANARVGPCSRTLPLRARKELDHLKTDLKPHLISPTSPRRTSVISERLRHSQV